MQIPVFDIFTCKVTDELFMKNETDLDYNVIPVTLRLALWNLKKKKKGFINVIVSRQVTRSVPTCVKLWCSK